MYSRRMGVEDRRGVLRKESIDYMIRNIELKNWEIYHHKSKSIPGGDIVKEYQYGTYRNISC